MNALDPINKTSGHDTAASDRLITQIAICAALLLASASVFYTFPVIDLTVSSWFYAPDGGFFLGKTWPIVTIRRIGIIITSATIAALIALGVWWQLRPAAMARWPSATPRADWYFITAGMALGPGILVNLIFKPLWGRPRPVQTSHFAGPYEFTPAWGIGTPFSGQYSFVSGEAAATAFVLAFCFIVPARWRLTTLVAGIILTLAISFARVAAGGHYLSDVMTSWILMLLMILILRAQIYHGAWLGPLKRWWPVKEALTKGE